MKKIEKNELSNYDLIREPNKNEIIACKCRKQGIANTPEGYYHVAAGDNFNDLYHRFGLTDGKMIIEKSGGFMGEETIEIIGIKYDYCRRYGFLSKKEKNMLGLD